MQFATLFFLNGALMELLRYGFTTYVKGRHLNLQIFQGNVVKAVSQSRSFDHTDQWAIVHFMAIYIASISEGTV